MKTTLNEIRAFSPCESGWKKLLAHLGKTNADDEPLAITTVLDSNGLDDTIWCFRAVKGHDREIRLFVVWCARQVQHLMTDPRSLSALDVAERFANGHATDQELANAWTAAGSANEFTTELGGWAAAESAAWAATKSVAWTARWCADSAAEAGLGGLSAARLAQEKRLREVCAQAEQQDHFPCLRNMTLF